MTAARRGPADGARPSAPLLRNPYADGLEGFADDPRERQLGVLTCVIAAGLLAGSAGTAAAAVPDDGSITAPVSSATPAADPAAAARQAAGAQVAPGAGATSPGDPADRIEERLERVESDVARLVQRLEQLGGPDPAAPTDAVPTWSWARTGSTEPVGVVEVAPEDLPADVVERMRAWLLPGCAPDEPAASPTGRAGTDRQALVQEARQQLDGCWRPFRSAVAAVLDDRPAGAGPVVADTGGVQPSPVLRSAAVRSLLEDWVDHRIDDVVRDVLAPTVAELELAVRELGARAVPAAPAVVPASPALLQIPPSAAAPPG